MNFSLSKFHFFDELFCRYGCKSNKVFQSVIFFHTFHRGGHVSLDYKYFTNLLDLFRGSQLFVSGNIVSEGQKSPEIFGFNE